MGRRNRPRRLREVLQATRTGSGTRWDSWELFVAVGSRYCAMAAASLWCSRHDLLPEKERTRRAILEAGAIEFLHNLGSDWFDDVRMGAVVLQLRRGTVPIGAPSTPCCFPVTVDAKP